MRSRAEAEARHLDARVRDLTADKVSEIFDFSADI